MTIPLIRLSFLALVLALLVAPAAAENPKVSLKVQNATAMEAAEQLSKAASVKLEVRAGRAQGGVEDRASFNWSSATFARALRELCEKFGLRPNRRPDGAYHLYGFQAVAPAGAHKPVGLFERKGVRVFAGGVQIYEHRIVGFVDGMRDWSSASMNLQIGCQLAEGDGETVAGLANVSARDDQGNLVVGDPQAGLSSGGSHDQQFPDEWMGSVSLSLPHPKAKKLVWVEGDLLVYRRFRPLRAEIRVPEPGKSVRQEVGDAIFLLSHLQPVTPDPAGDVDDPLFTVGRQNSPGFRIRVRSYLPNDSLVKPRFGDSWSLQPVAVGVSGKAYEARRTEHSGGFGNLQGIVRDASYTFFMDERPTRLVIDLAERSDPEKVLTFRLAEVPLPPAAGLAAGRRVNPPPPLTRKPPAADRPFFEAGGGALLSRVEIETRPAADGILAIGLAAKSGDGFGGIRWTNVDVDAEGWARLDDLKPGSYRVLRVYRPKEGERPLPAGRWAGNEVTVEIAPGKEVTLPPLRWSPDPEEGPKPVRPAAPRPSRPVRR